MCAAGELERAFHRFRATVAEKEGIPVRSSVFGQRLTQQPAQQRAVHLHHVRQVRVEDVLDGLFDGRVVAPDVVHAVAAQEIEVVFAILVKKISALCTCINLVEPNGAQHLNQRPVKMLFVEVVVFPEAVVDNFFKVKIHVDPTVDPSDSTAQERLAACLVTCKFPLAGWGGLRETALL